jgi:hypothetical protein
VASADSLFKAVNDSLSRMLGPKGILNSSSLELGCIITSEKLNFFRLILTWTSEGNVIRQDSKVTTKKAFQSVEISCANEVSHDQLSSLFPIMAYNNLKVSDQTPNNGNSNTDIYDRKTEKESSFKKKKMGKNECKEMTVEDNELDEDHEEVSEEGNKGKTDLYGDIVWKLESGGI